MELLVHSPEFFERVLQHEEHHRGLCSRLVQEGSYVLAANCEIPGPSANAYLRIRTDRQEAAVLLRRAARHRFAVVLDTESTPRGLLTQLRKAGFVTTGRKYPALLDPAHLVELPGPAARFTAVGPGELGRFIQLAGKGTGGEEGVLWGLRLRNLLFSGYLAESPEGAQACFGVFHSGALARLCGPYPRSVLNDYAFCCRIVSHAWERARQKKATALYALVGEEEIDQVKSLGFRVNERWFLEEYCLR